MTPRRPHNEEEKICFRDGWQNDYKIIWSFNQQLAQTAHKEATDRPTDRPTDPTQCSFLLLVIFSYVDEQTKCRENKSWILKVIRVGSWSRRQNELLYVDVIDLCRRRKRILPVQQLPGAPILKSGLVQEQRNWAQKLINLETPVLVWSLKSSSDERETVPFFSSLFFNPADPWGIT